MGHWFESSVAHKKTSDFQKSFFLLIARNIRIWASFAYFLVISPVVERKLKTPFIALRHCYGLMNWLVNRLADRLVMSLESEFFYAAVLSFKESKRVFQSLFCKY